MKLLIGGKNRNIYKRKDGSAYYKSGGQQVDITYMFKKNGGGLKKKYIKGGMTEEEEFENFKQKCIELHDKLNELYKELKDHLFNFESNDFISDIISAYYKSNKPLNQLANEINEDITKFDTNKYKLIEKLSRVINHITDKNDGTRDRKIKEYLDEMYNASDKQKFDTIKSEVLAKLALIIGALAAIIREDLKIDVAVQETPIEIDEEKEKVVQQKDKDGIKLTLDKNDPDEDQDGIKGIKFDPIKIDSKATDKKKTLKQICCLALYGLAAGMTDGLKVETSENKDNNDKIKVLNKIKNIKDFINHLEKSTDNKLSINENSTVEDINSEIKQFGFVNYNDGDDVFVTRAYILNKILQCFEGIDYIASSKKNVKRTNKKLLLNGKKILINPETGIMKSIVIEDLLQIFTNIHTIVDLTNGTETEIDISFNNLYYVLFSEEDIGSSQTVTEEANPEQEKNPFDEIIKQLREENNKRKKKGEEQPSERKFGT